MTNRFGVDVDYFRREFKALTDTLNDRTPGELSRYLRRLATVASPTDDQSICKECKKSKPQDGVPGACRAQMEEITGCKAFQEA